MTKRDLYTIIIKVLGIFVIKDILLFLPQLLSVIIMVANPDGAENGMTTLGLSLFMLLIYLFISYCLIFQSDWIAERLKLCNTGDDETILINIHRSTVLSIAIFVIGGLLLTEEIPNFCRQVYMYWELKKANFGNENEYMGYLILAGIKILIGLLLIGNQKGIVSYIELKRKK